MRNTKTITLAADDYAGQLALVCGIPDAAKILKVSTKRTTVFCTEGRLAAKQLGRGWAVCRQAALDLAKIPRPPGKRATLSKVSRENTGKKKRSARR